MAHPLRAKISRGLPMRHDRLFIVRAPEWEGAFTEYNLEITGWTEEIGSLAEFEYLYGMRPWPIFDLAKKRGWEVEEVEDRR